LTIEDGILNTVKVAVICCGEIYRKGTLDRLLDWVENGGILIGYNIQNLRACETDESYQNTLFNEDSTPKKIGRGISFFIPIKVNLFEGIKQIIPGTQPLEIPLKEDIEYYQKNLFDPITEFLNHRAIM